MMLNSVKERCEVRVETLSRSSLNDCLNFTGTWKNFRSQNNYKSNQSNFDVDWREGARFDAAGDCSNWCLFGPVFIISR